jgi:rfaE bifunctional protein nucleotidyltransferase chain/domain
MKSRIGLLELDEFLKIRRKLREENKKLVFTNGCFDIIHRGHVDYLTRARELGDALVVALNSDESVSKLKGEGRPVVTLIDRAFVISNLKCVDFVISFAEETPFEIISKVIPDILVKGGDWKTDQIVGRDIVENNGGKVFSLNYLDNYSTTSLFKKIKQL